jgi:hypothetical protein
LIIYIRIISTNWALLFWRSAFGSCWDNFCNKSIVSWFTVNSTN